MAGYINRSCPRPSFINATHSPIPYLYPSSSFLNPLSTTRATSLKMVTTKSLIALAALLPALSLAAPTNTTTSSSSSSSSSSSEVKTTKPFTFSSWVEDLLNPDPSVVALTPEQAIEAYHASINSTSPTTEEEITKRAGNPVCLNGAARVNIADAVAVINEMASQGEKYYTINAEWTTLWMAGAARLTGVLADTVTAQRIWA